MSAGGAASVAVLVFGMVVALALAQPSLDSAKNELEDAREEASKELVSIRSTEFSITSCTHNNTTGRLNVTIRNSGATVIPVDELSFVVDGYLRSLSSDCGKNLYPLGSCLFYVKNVTTPSRLRVVGPYGIAAQCDVGGA